MLAFGNLSERGSWATASRGSAQIAPAPKQHPGAIVQVYGARTLGWRGAFGIHTWIATKRRDATGYNVHHVIGWRYYYGGSPVVSGRGTPDFKWFGATPVLLADHHGPAAGAMIDQIEQAVADYPFDDFYRVWPGPNSNTFTAFVARQVPRLQLDLPANALGKDYLGETTFFAPAPSGTGWQFSILGVLGITLARAEGIEVNLLGLSAGLDIDDFAIRIPGVGRLSIW
jgi:hypothetical protein